MQLDLLWEQPGLPGFGLGAELRARYGGDLGFARPRLYANLVASVDGVVTLAEGGESGSLISGDSEADRFVMGLLRACADAVLIGAGTLRADPGALWCAEAIYPPAAAELAGLRASLGLAARPRLVVVTGSGQLDPLEPALAEALVVTTPAGERRLRGRAPAGARVVDLGTDVVHPAALMALLEAEGLGAVLIEGGPSLLGELLGESLVDELFLTSSPRLFGRRSGDHRKSLVEGVDLAGRPLALLSARRSGSHLFLRYQVGRGASRV